MPNITKEDFKQDLQELVEIENQKQMNLAVLFENSFKWRGMHRGY